MRRIPTALRGPAPETELVGGMDRGYVDASLLFDRAAERAARSWAGVQAHIIDAQRETDRG